MLALYALAAAAQIDANAMVINIVPGPGKNAKLTLGDASVQALTFLSPGAGIFKIDQNSKTILTFDTANATVTPDGKNISGVIRADGDLSVNGTLYADDMDVDAENDLAQWSLIYHDMFHENNCGWDTNFTSTCGSTHKILGGHCKMANNEVQKNYAKLPSHKQVRVVARYYFIDDWDDYTGYAKIDGKTIWTEEYTWCRQMFTFLCVKGKSVCGKEDYPDKIGRLIDVAMPHDSDDVTVTFGSTMSSVDPCEASYGLQGVSVYVR